MRDSRDKQGAEDREGKGEGRVRTCQSGGFGFESQLLHLLPVGCRAHESVSWSLRFLFHKMGTMLSPPRLLAWPLPVPLTSEAEETVSLCWHWILGLRQPRLCHTVGWSWCLWRGQGPQSSENAGLVLGPCHRSLLKFQHLALCLECGGHKITCAERMNKIYG